MLGILSDTEIDDLLKTQFTGRIGCCADNMPYVVPINYVYKNGYIYGHSASGKKIATLRKNPQVCFQVDDIENIMTWKSVIAWGTYSEITEREEMQTVMQEIIHHIMPSVADIDAQPSHGITENESDVGTSIELILYKIHLHKITGRFENHQTPPVA